jgi:hypothetical protein
MFLFKLDTAMNVNANTLKKLNNFWTIDVDMPVPKEVTNFIENPSKTNFDALETTFKRLESAINQQPYDNSSKSNKPLENHIAIITLFSELFKDPCCQKHMMSKETLELVYNHTPTECIIITSFYMKAYIDYEINNKISAITAYLKSIHSNEASSHIAANREKPLVAALIDSLNPLTTDYKAFGRSGNFTYLLHQYNDLLQKYSDPSNNTEPRSYREQAYSLICSFIRGLLRSLDYIKTFITTGEFKAGSHEKDLANGGTTAFVQQPTTFEGLNKLSIFVREVEALVQTETLPAARLLNT